MAKSKWPQVLIVEDDEVARTQYREWLGKLATLRTAERVDEVFEKMLDGIDLIILDIRLEGERVHEPTYAGVSILKRVKQLSPPFKDIPVIVVTGLDKPELEAQCLELGAVAFFKKTTMEPRTLVEITKKYLAKSRQQGQLIKIFVSSTMLDLEAERRVVKQAIQDLGKKYVIRLAEDFPAENKSPRDICRKAVRDCDVFILLVGERYGKLIAEDDISPTEDEYNAARKNKKPILVFVKDLPNRDNLVDAFLTKLRAYDKGHWVRSFSDLEGLRRETQKALKSRSGGINK